MSFALGPARRPDRLAVQHPRLDVRPIETGPPGEPPDAAPGDPFGYTHPVRGCFEGRVYAVPERIDLLPVDWRPLEHVTTLWACEWNVFTELRHHGFDGAPELMEWFAVRYVGGFHVREPGVYHFRVSSDDGVRLVVSGHPVVVDPGMHATRSTDGEVELTAGDHTLSLEYVQGGGHVNLQVFVTPPGGDEGLLTVRSP